jgi:hypothetical protein
MGGYAPFAIPLLIIAFACPGMCVVRSYGRMFCIMRNLLRVDIEVARHLQRLVPAVHGGGASETHKVGLVQPSRFAQVVGPRLHPPELYPSIRSSHVFVKPPHQGSGAQPDVADLRHRGEERVAVG